jgi:hypothetical protein
VVGGYAEWANQCVELLIDRRISISLVQDFGLELLDDIIETFPRRTRRSHDALISGNEVRGFDINC